MSENPWKKLKTDSVYENSWIRVDKSDVIMPNGEPGDYTVVHFKNIATGCVPVDEEGNIFLVGQWRFPFDKYSWEIPLGGADPNKSTLEECKRELKEETGIEASYWRELLRTDLSNSVTDETAIIYMCIGLKIGKSNPEECEKIDVRKIKFEDSLKMIMDGEITDSLTVMSLLKLAVMTETLPSK